MKTFRAVFSCRPAAANKQWNRLHSFRFHGVATVHSWRFMVEIAQFWINATIVHFVFFSTWKSAKKEKKEQIIDLIRSLPFIKLHLIGLLASDNSFIIYESRFFFSQFRISSLFKLESDSLKIQINECQIPTGKTHCNEWYLVEPVVQHLSNNLGQVISCVLKIIINSPHEMFCGGISSFTWYFSLRIHFGRRSVICLRHRWKSSSFDWFLTVILFMFNFEISFVDLIRATTDNHTNLNNET